MIVDFSNKNKWKRANQCEKSSAIIAAMIAVSAGFVTVMLVFVCYAPVKNLASKAEDDFIQLAGNEISLQNAPLWRLCALDGIGPKTAQEIVEQRVQ